MPFAAHQAKPWQLHAPLHKHTWEGKDDGRQDAAGYEGRKQALAAVQQHKHHACTGEGAAGSGGKEVG